MEDFIRESSLYRKWERHKTSLRPAEPAELNQPDATYRFIAYNRANGDEIIALPASVTWENKAGNLCFLGTNLDGNYLHEIPSQHCYATSSHWVVFDPDRGWDWTIDQLDDDHGFLELHEVQEFRAEHRWWKYVRSEVKKARWMVPEIPGMLGKIGHRLGV